MTRGITKEDIDDLAVVDMEELRADGHTAFASLDVLATYAETRLVVVESGLLIHDPDTRLEFNDLVTISGSAAAGSYTVSVVIDDVSFTVQEAIVDSTGGAVAFMHPSGASRVGIDTTGFTHSAESTVQTVLADFDTAISGGGITEEQHEALDTLAHEIVETSFDEVLYTGSRATGYIVWTDASKTKKIREEEYIYTGGKITQMIYRQYDGTGVLKKTITEDYTYSGSNVSTVTRVIS
jgi:hypothetical protein